VLLDVFHVSAGVGSQMICVQLIINPRLLPYYSKQMQ
jgi:hypothetical protein